VSLRELPDGEKEAKDSVAIWPVEYQVLKHGSLGERQGSPGGGSSVKDKVKILIADDEEIIRNLLTEYLTDEGFNVIAVPSGEKALEVFKNDPNHLVITDIRMGGMSGVQLLEEIKKVDSDAQIIMITSHASLDTAVATLRAGAYDYIFKPFEDLNQITEIVTRAMEKIELILKNRELVKDLEQSNLRLELSNLSMEESNEKLRELATQDGLTGLLNHRHFMDILDEELTRTTRYERVLCLIMLDVDNFKMYNDSQGHPAGDEVLKTLADIIKNRLRDVDRSARYGGEEFVILLPETDWKNGKIVAEDIRVQMESYPFKGRESQPLGKVTVSLGVAEFPADGSDTPSLLKKADEALYRAKNQGRNRVVCTTEGE
jgi:diguanylate cyclase (GGDEF)-like protein